MPTAESVEFSLPRPHVTQADAVRVLRDVWGLEAAAAVELGSQQDRNFRVDTAAGRFVLKFGNPGLPLEQLRLQHTALARLAVAAPEIRVPAPRSTIAGDDIAIATVDGVELPVRCVSWVEGAPLTDLPPTPALARSLGETAARIVTALSELAHVDAPFTGWDLRVAADLVRELAPSIPDEHLRAVIEGTAANSATHVLFTLADRLPVQLIHGDITDDNVVADPTGERVAGVIDFGDLAPGWRVAELAVGTATLLSHSPEEPWRVLEQVRAFDTVAPLDDAEIAALWPLVTLRAAALVAAAHHQLALDGENPHVEQEIDRNERAFHAAAEIGWDEAELVLRGALRPLADAPTATARLLPAGTPVTHLDLSVYSPVWDAGAWLDEGAVEDEVACIRATGSVVATRHAEARPDRGIALSPVALRSVSLGVELFLDAGTPLTAPFAGDARVDDDTLVLAADGAELRIEGAVLTSVGFVEAGDPLGASGERLRIAAVRACGLTLPARIRANERALWADICPDPLPWIGVDSPALDPGIPASTAVPATALLERREASYARVHERYFANPPRIERGWRHYLLDEDGRSYLDIVNNVAAVGHGHPRIAEVAAAQWRRLNTNSRFHYGELVRYSERLAALAPDGLDTVFLVNSGTEAVDLAIRLVRAATGRPTVVGLREAYHGWSMASDAVSSSLNDNPNALASRPDWVRLADVPNPVRGTHRGPGSGPAYVADLETLIAELVAEGTPPAGFIGEAVFGNGGGVLLPDGYLAGAYAAVRAAGGLCIADEVQVGFGRLGHHFWAFEQQGAVPDVITVAKSIGNGQPLGAVITTRAIADAFASEGSFFSSAGGSPVSCAVGNAVLDILEDEHLIENARVVGDHLRDRLVALGERHASAGAVHGMGLYLGLELVADRHTMTPDGELARAVCETLLTEGVIVLPTGDGKNVLKIKPPMTLTAADADYFVERLDAVLSRLGA